MLGYPVVAIPVGVITSEVLAAKKAREALLAGEETERREFMSSAFYSNADPNIPPRVIFEASVLKPAAGFLNARGGFLFIGVVDNTAPLGIQPDLDMKTWTTKKYVRISLNGSVRSSVRPRRPQLTSASRRTRVWKSASLK